MNKYYKFKVQTESVHRAWIVTLYDILQYVKLSKCPPSVHRNSVAQWLSSASLSFLPRLFLQFTISSMSSVLSINSCHPSPSFFSLSFPLLPIKFPTRLPCCLSRLLYTVKFSMCHFVVFISDIRDISISFRCWQNIDSSWSKQACTCWWCKPRNTSVLCAVCFS